MLPRKCQEERKDCTLQVAVRFEDSDGRGDKQASIGDALANSLNSCMNNENICNLFCHIHDAVTGAGKASLSYSIEDLTFSFSFFRQFFVKLRRICRGY